MKKKNDVFENAGSAVTEISSGKKGKIKKIIEWMADFEVFVSLAVFLKTIEGVKEQMDEEYKEEAYRVFFDEIMESGDKPKSFDVKAGCSSATYQFRKKPSFDDELAQLLDKYKIPYDVTETVAEGFLINPEILKNPALKAKMSAALEKVDFGVPALVKQKSVRKCSMDEAKTIPAIVERVKNKEEREALLRGISYLALATPALDGDAKVEDNPDLMQKALLIMQQNGVVTMSEAAKKKKVKKSPSAA